MVRVAGLSIAPGRTGTIPLRHWQAWLAQSTWNQQIATTKLDFGQTAEAPPEPPSEPTAPVDTPPADDRKAKLTEAIRSMLQEDQANIDRFTQSGKPRLEVLEDITGLEDVTAAERDEVLAELG